VESANRRQFLAAAGLAGLGAAVGTAQTPAASAAAPELHSARAGQRVAFHGRHQAGIATSTPEHVHFVALDFLSDASGDLRALIQSLSAAAARLAAGRPVGPVQTGASAPVDTGEAEGLGPAALTVTFGFGPGLFRAGRLTPALRRPRPLVELPSFSGDALEESICGGDIAIQVCAEDPQVAFHAAHDLTRLAAPTAVPRWALAGFGRTLNSRGRPTPRNLMGFKEGTGNIMNRDTEALKRFVWAGEPESPTWMRDGSYMVVRRIEMLLGNWDSVSLDQQEQTFGRAKLSGAPLGERREFDRLDLSARSDGRLKIPAHAHVRLASPEYNHGQRLLRRGYSYVGGVDRGQESVAAGQLFICFQRDPQRQFIPIQRRLAGSDNLSAHIRHIGSAIFACPPGAAVGSYVGARLFS
jgi:deferrochelatase/peroxidase EfeB